MTAPDPGPLVAVVGDVMNDVLARPLAPIEPATDTPSEIIFSPGGSGANQAAWLAALGTRVRFAARVGADDIDRHREALGRLGVDARLSEEPEGRTGTVVVLVSAEGERSMLTDRGANSRLVAGDLDDVLEEAALLHLSGYSFFVEPARSAVRHLMTEAARRGVPVTVDPASTAGLRSIGPSAFLEWTKGAGVVFPNLDEGRLLSGEEAVDAVAGVLLRSYPVVALKLGAAGALVATAEGRLRLPAGGEGIVDPTGAGDAFCAGFLSRYVLGAGLQACAASAVAAASIATGVMGARPPGRL